MELNSMNDQQVFEHLLKLIEHYYSARKEGQFLDYKTPEELENLLDFNTVENNDDWEVIFSWIEKYLKYCVKTGHPQFVNRMWSEANLPSVLGEMITALTNTSACTFESAPVSTLMEKHMIGEMLELAGFRGGDGQMTTGSSNANMIAMMLARNNALDSVKKCGLFGQQKLFGFVGADAHYSMDKAANILGIGTEQLIKVPLGEDGSMLIEELVKNLEMVMASGGRPFLVAATAGTTVRGAYDPIEPLVELRSRFGFWLHVDGAWGGAAVMSDDLRARYLAGLEHADSFTCDFHKMLGSALMCNVLLINKNSNFMGQVLAAGDTSYLFRDEDQYEAEDLGAMSLQCGRKVDGLKWFLDWKFYGRKGLGKRIESYLSLAEYAEKVVTEHDELELVAPRTSFNVCFCYKVPSELSNKLNLELRTRLYQQGKSLVGVAYIDGRLVMRLIITNPETTRADIDVFFANVLETGRELAAAEPV